MAWRDEFVGAARACLGTPFRHQGRQAGRGLDCVGVLVVAARAAGLSDYDVAGYSRLPQGARMAGHLREAGLHEISVDAARAGDILLMRFERDPQHLALVTDRGILHAHQRAGAVVEHRLDAAWRRRIVAAYSFGERD